MAQWILKSNGEVVPRRTLRILNPKELHSPEEQKKRDLFDELIPKRWGTFLTPPTKPQLEFEFEAYEDNQESPIIIPVAEDPVDTNGRAINLQPEYDRLINLELGMPQGEVLRSVKVIGRTHGPDGNCAGTYDHNSIMNTMTYGVEFPGGEVREYAANIIAENILSQVDNEEFTLQHLSQIVDASSDASAVPKSAMYCTTKRGNRRMRHTTCGWKMLIRWKDGSETWMPLKDLK